jgi:MYXO-CTERM domain-containing protein
LSGLGGGGSLAFLASFPCTGGTAGTDPDCGWVFSSDLTNLSNLSGAPFAGGDATPPPSQNGLNAGANGTFYRVTLTFNTTGTVNDLTNVVFGLHAVAGPNNCSTKFQVARTGTNTGTVSSTDQPDPLCDDGSPPTEITPEPMTLTLMATGLVGLAGVGAIRRRRKV